MKTSRKEKKILILAGGGYIFGAETITLSIIKYLNNNFNIHCSINGWNDGKFISILKSENVRFTEIKLGWIYIKKIKWTLDTLFHAPYGYLQYYKLLKKWKPDLCYHTSYRTLLQLYPLLNKSNVFHVHDMLSGTIGEKIIKRVDQKVMVYIAVSEAIKQNLIKCGIDHTKIKIINNGIDFTNENAIVFPHELTGIFRIGIIGQLVPRKGHALLFEAISSEKFSNKKIIIDVYGSGSEEYLSQLKHLTEIYKINDSVVFHGYESNKAKIYNSVDFCVVPSIEPEPFGLTVIEPSVYNKLTIGSDIGAISEIIQNNFSGLLFDPKNINTLVDQLFMVMENPNMIKEMGRNAKQHYYSKYSDHKMNEEVYHLISEKI